MLNRFLSFAKRLLTNKKSAFGLFFIGFFVFLALGAPLLTPYTALGEIPGKSYWPVAYSSVKPTWLRFFPTWLGGDPTLSEGMRVVNNPGRPSFDEFNFSWSGEGSVTANVDDIVGFPRSAPPGFDFLTQNGSLAIKYVRNSGAGHNLTTAVLSIPFDWPYSGPPGRFIGSLSLLVEGTYSLVENKTVMDPITGENYTAFHKYLEVPLKINTYIEQVGGKKWPVFPMPIMGETGPVMGIAEDKSLYNISQPTVRYPWGIVEGDSGIKELEGWVISRLSIDSKGGYIDSESNTLVNKYTIYGLNSYPQKMIFTAPGKYVYGLELTFVDDANSTKNVETTVHVDDFGLLFYGTSFGLLGADHHGRDLWSQLIYGTRISLYLGILVAGFSVVIGLAVGLAAGYLGKVVDEVLMRTTDVLLVLPGLPLLIVLVAVLGATIENLVLLLGVLGWMGFARLVRSQVLSIKERPFVEAAKAIGAGKFHIITSHVLPSVMSLVYITLATSVPGAVTAEAALSWLGFFDPTRMSWGRMLYNVFEADATASWWWVIPPGIFISILAASFILLGFALDEVLNPKLRMRK
jgi:ABC-type dipeptide/oligopeptide/nickel transport system permease subunit